MTPQEANALLVYARHQDHLVSDSQSALDTWISSLAHISMDAGKIAVQEYYGKHRDPQNRRPIDASVIRQIHRSKSSEFAAKERALNPPPPRKGNGPPTHVKARFNELYESVGYTPKERA